MVFAENLRKCREKAGLSQTALGAKMGLKGSVIGRYELGEATPKPDRILDFAYALNTDVNTLLGYEKKDVNEIEYAQNLLDNINVTENIVEYETVNETGDGEEQISIPKTEFLKMCCTVRLETEYLIQQLTESNREILFKEGLNREVDKFRLSLYKKRNSKK